MKKFWCEHFVPLTNMKVGKRQEAAEWAFSRFDSRNMDIFYNGPNDEPGFWFAYERDALLFSLRWSGE